MYIYIYAMILLVKNSMKSLSLQIACFQDEISSENRLETNVFFPSQAGVEQKKQQMSRGCRFLLRPMGWFSTNENPQ